MMRMITKDECIANDHPPPGQKMKILAKWRRDDQAVPIVNPPHWSLPLPPVNPPLISNLYIAKLHFVYSAVQYYYAVHG